MIETSLPPVLGHPNMYTSESDIVHKSSPDTSPLVTKKWSVSGYRHSREESNPWVCRYRSIFTMLVNLCVLLDTTKFTSQNECSINI